MGWNAWNTYGCDATQSLIESVADGLVANGMRDAGYRYIIVDDCWMERGADGKLTGNSSYPDMAGLGTYLHDRGFKFGLYEAPGEKTCAGRPGSAGHEVDDAATFAAWGVDYLKYDYCHGDSSISTQVADFTKMQDALAATGRDIVLSINPNSGSNYGAGVSRDWGDVSDLARTTEDIGNQWWGQSWPNGVANIISENAALAGRAKPGSFNDADMLEVGNGGLTATEEQTHFAMWAMMGSPLIASADPGKLDGTSLDLLKNADLIAIDQDSLGIQAKVLSGTRLTNSTGTMFLEKPLSDRSVAVAFYNGTDSAQNMTASLSDLGLAGNATWADAFSDQEWTQSSMSQSVPAHGTAVYRVVADEQPGFDLLVSPSSEARTYEAEDPGHSIVAGRWTNNSGAVFESCSGCSGEMKASWIGGTNKLYLTGVYAAHAGDYTVTVQYLNGGGDRTAAIWSNGENRQDVTFNGNGDWNTPQTQTVTVSLQAGDNTITFGNESGGWAPDIDNISVPAT